MTYMPKPGDIGLSSSTGLIGKFIRAAQAVIGDYTFVTHAFIVLHDGYIIEAMPGGATFARVDKYPDAIYSKFDLSPDQRDSICDEAIRLYGTPYSFLDYLAIGLEHFLPESRMFKQIDDRVKRSDKMICSQLVAEAYRRAGVPLTDTHPQYVTPGDLSKIFLEKS